MDPSSISSTSSSSNLSFSSTSQFYQHRHQSPVRRERSQLPMDYSDLTPLDHQQWKTMLPPDKQELVWRSASLSFFLDERTGKNSFLLGAKKVVSRSDWEMKSHPESRFSEVAELIDSWYFYIEGRIETRMLTPETLYAAYLVFGRSDKYAEPCVAKSIMKISYDDYDEEETRSVYFGSNNSRADGWREIQVGDFYVGVGGNRKVIVELSGSNYRCGLVVEGIEFRPVEGTEKQKEAAEIFSKLEIS